jgi:hypothetical protein
MKFHKITFVVLLATLLLAACSSPKAPVKSSPEQPASTVCATPEAGKIGTCKPNGSSDPTAIPTQLVEPQSELTKSDAQGAITVEIKPMNLDKPGDTLIFDVAMDTHSVDLSMDLAQLAVLTTDTGKTIQAIRWDGPRGGHHVEGKLSFPTTLDGKNLLDGARSITIIIKDVDSPARTFIWQITG